MLDRVERVLHQVHQDQLEVARAHRDARRNRLGIPDDVEAPDLPDPAPEEIENGLHRPAEVA